MQSLYTLPYFKLTSDIIPLSLKSDIYIIKVQGIQKMKKVYLEISTKGLIGVTDTFAMSEDMNIPHERIMEVATKVSNKINDKSVLVKVPCILENGDTEPMFIVTQKGFELITSNMSIPLLGKKAFFEFVYEFNEMKKPHVIRENIPAFIEYQAVINNLSTKDVKELILGTMYILKG